jgi:hypothetical protein
MRDRVAGHSVMEQVVRLQDAVEPRSAVARAFGISPLTEESWPWFAGATGEREVGAMLDRLPAGWTVFHAVPVGQGDADIDHLAVGPGGVFAINTKNHRGAKVWVAERAVLVNGAKQPYLRNSELEASRIRHVLAGAGLVSPVHAVVAVVSPASMSVRQQPMRVTVLTAEGLLRWMTRRPAVVDNATASAIAELFDRPGTWRPVVSDRSTVDRFDSLAREVHVARWVQKGWMLAAALSVVAVVLAALPR